MPITKEPLSPKNIFEYGKFKIKKQNNIKANAIKKKFKSLFISYPKLNNKKHIMINEWIANSPLNPSIKFDPLTQKKIENKTKKEAEYIEWLFKKFKILLSKSIILILKLWIKMMFNRRNKKNLFIGLIIIFVSSKKPRKKFVNKKIII